MSSVNPDVPAPTPAPTVQSKISDLAHEAADAVHHAADAVRADVAAIGTHLTTLFTTASVEGLIAQVEASLALLPPKLAEGEAAVASLLTPEDIAALEEMFTRLTQAGILLVREYLARKVAPVAPTTPAVTPETANAAR